MSETVKLRIAGDFTRLDSEEDFWAWTKQNNVSVFEKYHKPQSYPCAAMTVDEMIDTGSPPNEYQTTVPVPHFLYPANVRALADLLPEPAQKYSGLTPRDFGKNIPLVPDTVWYHAFAPSETGWHVQVGAHNEAPTLTFIHHDVRQRWFAVPLLISGPFETKADAKRDLAQSASEWHKLMPTVEVFDETYGTTLAVHTAQAMYAPSAMREWGELRHQYMPILDWLEQLPSMFKNANGEAGS